MNKYKIGVYAICKNEENFVDRWIDSMKEADVIVVCDTGSTDNTIEKLKSRGVVVQSIEVKPWRFDVARNLAMNLLPNDVDICVSTDLDEVLEPGWRDKIEKIWTPKATRLRYSYTWNFNLDGSRGTSFIYEKIHKRYGFKWIKPVHEVLYYFGREPDVYVTDETIQLNHYPDPTKSRNQYLSLLELSVKEFPNDDKDILYLGREYLFHNMYDKSIETLKKYLQMPNATWSDERCASMRFIARSYIKKGNTQESIKWLYRAIAEAPCLREPYVEMAQLAYLQEDWLTVYSMIEKALSIKNKPCSYLTEDFCWDYNIYDLGALSSYYLNLFDKSLEYATIAMELSPKDNRLVNNYMLIKNRVAQIQS